MKINQTKNPAPATPQSEAVGLAACTFEIDLAQPDKLVQLTPTGYFKSAQDNRPEDVPGGHWYIDADVASRVIAHRLSLKNDLLFDYEHQTLNAEKNGQPAPAAGWGRNTSLIWKDEGLFIKGVEWTEAATEAIRKKEYRYISPVFTYNKSTGHVLQLLHVAICNWPGIDGMQDLVASLTARLNSTTQTPTIIQSTTEPSMNEELKWLLTLLGINVEADIDAAALKQQLTNDPVKLKLVALKTQVSQHGELKTQNTALTEQVAALKANTAQPDLKNWVPAATHAGVVQELAALTASVGSQSVEQLISDAQKDGKLIVEAEMGYLKELGNQDLVALKANLDARMAVAALKGEKQTDGVKPPPQDPEKGTAALTADQRLIADQFGISYQDLAKNLTGDE